MSAWHAYETHDPNGGRDEIIIVANAGYLIARIDLPLYRSKGIDGSDDVISQRCQANARLIAAAPELLAALEDALGTISALHGGASWALYEAHSPAIQRAMTAIAEARGSTRAVQK